MKVLELVGVEEGEVRETVILTAVVAAGTVNLYHTSRRLPQFPVPLPFVTAALYKVPVVGEQEGFTVNVTALVQPSLEGDWENESLDSINKNAQRTNGFFIRLDFYY